MGTRRQWKPVLVIGATGYVGGRLVKLLLRKGCHVRAMARSLDKLRARFPEAHHRFEGVRGNVLDPVSLRQAADGCRAAYYLVHSMSSGRKFVATDRRAAHNMARAASAAGLERIIYLGGIGGEGVSDSRHLASRYEVGRILRKGPVPVTILQAAVILGSGSASFEIIRYVVDRLPVIVAPKTLFTRCQPICIRDVLGYLVACLARDETIGQTYDIGGPDILTYKDLIDLYSKHAGLGRRRTIILPFFGLGLVSYLVGLITPVPRHLVSPLIRGLGHEVICRDSRIRDIVPQRLMSCDQAIQRALEKISQQIVDTYYTDAGMVHRPEWVEKGDEPYSGGAIMSCAYHIRIRTSADQVWELIKNIGGDTGWYFAGRLWWLRGFMDKLVGGVGLDRGRRHPRRIQIGDVLDFWRVLDVRIHRRLVLLAEMRLPGEAILEFIVESRDGAHTELTMNARFLAKGLAGLVYWYSVSPFHDYVFKGMLANIAKKCNAGVITGPRRMDD
ncbi:MAG: SDR family oxidoreductase [Desulfobacteraceae bacterium]|nr:SDR family oxidoreductase [Desulfobacteraceae bacterium]